jgi:hypothetical protein
MEHPVKPEGIVYCCFRIQVSAPSASWWIYNSPQLWPSLGQELVVDVMRRSYNSFGVPLHS